MSTIAPEKTSVSVTAGRSEITMETGHLAKQADGAVVLRSGDTMILATATGRLEAREGADFFPLTVDVEERMYAAGKIPGGFFKREGRPTEKAILTARMIDRPIRPLWPKGFRNEVQVICTTLSADLVTPYDILCINGASAALMISPLPFQGPVGAVRIALIDGELVINPSLPEVEDSDLDLIVVGTKEGLTMVEAGAAEVPEEKLLEAFDIAHVEIRKLCEAQEDLRRQVGKPKWLDVDLTEELDSAHGERIASRISSDGLREGAAAVVELVEELCPPLTIDSTEEDIVRETQVRSSLDAILERRRLEAVLGPVREQFEDGLRALTEAEQDSKQLKSAKRALLYDNIIESVDLPFPVGPATVEGEAPAVKDNLTRNYVKKAAEAIYKELIRRKIAVEKRRPDGRGTDEIRPIACEVGSARARTARRCSSAERRRSSRSSRWAPRRRGSASTTSPSSRSAATCTTTTSRPTRSGRRASCEARSGATSATAPLPSARSSRSSRPLTSSRTRSASSRRRSSRTARRRWAPSAARRSR